MKKQLPKTIRKGNSKLNFKFLPLEDVVNLRKAFSCHKAFAGGERCLSQCDFCKSILP